MVRFAKLCRHIIAIVLTHVMLHSAIARPEYSQFIFNNWEEMCMNIMFVGMVVRLG